MPTNIELIELSDLAWTIVDPDGEHEPLEQDWIAAMPHDWPPPEAPEELRERLAVVTATLRTAGNAGLLRVVAAVTVHLAGHPELRRPDPALITAALRAEYPAGIPAEIEAWLARRPAPAAHERSHGAPVRQPRVNGRPPLAD
jgi:hypothetical protein